MTFVKDQNIKEREKDKKEWINYYFFLIEFGIEQITLLGTFL